MKLPSLEELSRLIGDIYDVGLDQARWVDVLPRIAQAFDAVTAGFWLHDSEGRFFK